MVSIFVLLAVSTNTAFAAADAASPIAKDVPPGHSKTIIQVRFQEGTDLHPPKAALPAELQSSVAHIKPLSSLSKPQLDILRAKGEKRSGRALPSMALWYQITLKPDVDPVAFIEALKAAPNVEVAEYEPLPAPPPATTPDFTALQGYLDPATDGIDAEYAWTLGGGDGTGITIYDIEYNWLQTHEDLTKASGPVLLLDPGDSNSPPGYTGCPAPCDPVNREHGTAVLGELIANNDTIGVTGIAWGADIRLAPARTTNLGYNLTNAILLAVADASAGDVILLEQQTAVCGLPDPANTCANCGPVEWTQSVFDAIQTATANGIVVVEAAGNGGVDLDQAACGDTFDPTVRDSGAIMVGAGFSPLAGALDRQREGFSTYGARVDVQGWGDSVRTTGYGDAYSDPDDPTNPNRWYTSFAGTSSASPMAAGAAAVIQGVSFNRFGTPLTPGDMRDLLKDTGSPQQGNTAENIGPRPDLRRAIKERLNRPPAADADGPYSVAEGDTVTLYGSGSDPDGDPLTYAWDLDNDGTFETAGQNVTFSAAGRDGPDSQIVVLQVCDDAGACATSSTTVDITNVPPEVSVDLPAQTVQYSDDICDVTFTATDVAVDVLSASTEWSADGVSWTPGLPAGLSLSGPSCTDDGVVQTCTWTLAGAIGEPMGAYAVRVTVQDDDGGSDSADTAITVELEDATIWLDAGNPVAVQVDTPGGDSPPFTLTAHVQESTPDVGACGASPGDISLAEVSISLVPVGPGSTITALCTPIGVSGTGYDAVLTVECAFDDVPVNAYWVQATVVGDYYTSATVEDVLVVYDPSLGFTTGGGWFYWPGSEDPGSGYPGDKTSFGYVMKYTRKMQNVKGNLLLIRHMPDGSIYRVKSNALLGLAIGDFVEDGETVGWASFAGKATYQEPGWADPLGNYRFIVYVEDWNEPGAGYDQIWFELRNREDLVVPVMSMTRPEVDNTATLGGGNIVVPHNPD